MFKSVWYTYNIKSRFVNGPFSFSRWERAWLLRQNTPRTFDLTPGQGRTARPVKQLERVCWTNDPIMVLDKSALWR